VNCNSSVPFYPFSLSLLFPPFFDLSSFSHISIPQFLSFLHSLPTSSILTGALVVGGGGAITLPSLFVSGKEEERVNRLKVPHKNYHHRCCCFCRGYGWERIDRQMTQTHNSCSVALSLLKNKNGDREKIDFFVVSPYGCLVLHFSFIHRKYLGLWNGKHLFRLSS